MHIHQTCVQILENKNKRMGPNNNNSMMRGIEEQMMANNNKSHMGMVKHI